MEIRIEKRRFYTDQERYEWCRKCKLSGKTVTRFAKENNINRETLRDWMKAYNNINGKFINISNVSNKENSIIEEKDVTVNILSEIEKNKKRNKVIVLARLAFSGGSLSLLVHKINRSKQ